MNKGYLIVAHRTFVSPKSRHAGESVRVRADGEDDHVHGRSCVIRALLFTIQRSRARSHNPVKP